MFDCRSPAQNQLMRCMCPGTYTIRDAHPVLWTNQEFCGRLKSSVFPGSTGKYAGASGRLLRFFSFSGSSVPVQPENRVPIPDIISFEKIMGSDADDVSI